MNHEARGDDVEALGNAPAASGGTEDTDTIGARHIRLGLWVVLGCAFAFVLLLAGCSSDDEPAATNAASTSATPGTVSTTVGEQARWEPSCPKGFVPVEGLNAGFPSDGESRTFEVDLPEDTSSPRPVFVALTGTVQPEPDFLVQSGLDSLTEDGWLVITPYRTCSTEGTNCNGTGMQGDGRVWEPWFDGHPDPNHDEGPDARFMEAVVKCSATAWDVDEDRVYIGGISAGGSMTNHALTYASEFYAGGVTASGNWYSGLCCPRPLPKMDSSIVVVVWGGPNDRWPLTGTPLAVYAPETKTAAEYYAGEPNVVTVACSGTHGHIWPTAMTTWLAETLASHPKGADPASFALTDPPAGFTCVRGAYTDH